MTKEEKLAVLGDLEDRAYAAAKAVDPASEEFTRLVNSIRELFWFRADVLTHSDSDALHETLEKTKQVLTKEPESLSTVMADFLGGLSKPDPQPEQPTMTFTEVKKKMIQYQTAHDLDIAALMKSMGYERLSAIPAEKYDELIERAEAAIREKG